VNFAAGEEDFVSFDIRTVKDSSRSSLPEQMKNLCDTIGAVIASRLTRPDTPAVHDEAIGFLTNSHSELDEREWAERYLCGMAGADKDAFMKDRKSQS
jgi:hypothetical protein